jgi:hypothetical protein
LAVAGRTFETRRSASLDFAAFASRRSKVLDTADLQVLTPAAS